MNWLQALILGIVQGLSEFLPISSSGHLVLLQKLFNVNTPVLMFDTALHLATLIAVFVVFWKDIADMIRHPLSKLTLLVVVGTIPTVVIAIIFKDLIDRLFESGSTLGIEFIVTGLIIWYAEKAKNRNKGLEKMSYADAAFVGVAQGIAIMPAISRSGLTIAGALFRGLNREFAAKYSFLMSIPAILGASLLDGYKLTKGAELGMGAGPLIIGMIAAGISGYVAIKFMLNILTKGSLKIFSYYVFTIGGLVILEQIFSGKYFGRLF